MDRGDGTEPVQHHALERTGSKPGIFIGRCLLCGKRDLPSRAALWPCPNPRGFTAETVFAALVEGGKS